MALLVSVSYPGFSQTIGETLAFDAASVKPAKPPAESFGDGVSIARKQPGRSRRGGPGTDDPSRFYDPETTLQTLLVEAFDVGYFQVQGPEWLSEERFDVEATMPPQTTMIQFHSMLQNLLVERFKMSAHRERRELPGYALVVAKKAPKLKQPVESPAASDTRALPSVGLQPDLLGRDGFPASLPRHPIFLNGVPGFMAPYGWRLYFQEKTMRDLAAYLRVRLQCQVEDETELTSKYDFALTFFPRPTPPPDTQYPAAPNLFTALQSQLGLKLQSKRVSTEVIVIDHIEKKPVGN
jgi:uncharacterized protein (TIGR03435 family)